MLRELGQARNGVSAVLPIGLDLGAMRRAASKTAVLLADMYETVDGRVVLTPFGYMAEVAGDWVKVDPTGFLPDARPLNRAERRRESRPQRNRRSFP